MEETGIDTVILTQKGEMTPVWKAQGRLHRGGGIRLGFRSCVGGGCIKEAGLGIWPGSHRSRGLRKHLSDWMWR